MARYGAGAPNRFTGESCRAYSRAQRAEQDSCGVAAEAAVRREDVGVERRGVRALLGQAARRRVLRSQTIDGGNFRWRGAEVDQQHVARRGAEIRGFVHDGSVDHVVLTGLLLDDRLVDEAQPGVAGVVQAQVKAQQVEGRIVGMRVDVSSRK
jgi:hypothetical protein